MTFCHVEIAVMNDSVCKYIYNCVYFDIVIVCAMLKIRLKIINICDVVF